MAEQISSENMERLKAIVSQRVAAKVGIASDAVTDDVIHDFVEGITVITQVPERTISRRTVDKAFGNLKF